VPEVTQLPYKYFILDFGKPTSYMFPEFLHCDHRIVLTDTAIWKTAELDRFASELQKYNRTWDTCTIICTRGRVLNDAYLYKTYGIRVISAPLLGDPFHITSEQFLFFENLMKGEG
jgi:hypothetical protein